MQSLLGEAIPMVYRKLGGSAMSAPNRACLHLTNPTTWAWGTLAPTLTGNDNPQQLHLVSCCCPKVQPQPLLNLDLTPRLVFHF